MRTKVTAVLLAVAAVADDDVAPQWKAGSPLAPQAADK
jgi:hypothetical protein